MPISISSSGIRYTGPTSTGEVIKDYKKKWEKSDLGKTGGKIVKAVTGGVSSTGKKFDRWAHQGGFRDSGKVDYASRFGNFTLPTPKVKLPDKLKIPTSIKDTSLKNLSNQGTKALNKIKTEAGKLAKGDFSLKKAVQGTVSGASKTIKESDVGKGVKIIADKSGYTGSDFDKGLQKVEKETSNVANQTLDLVDSPAKVVNKAIDKIKKVIKPPELPKLKPLTPAPSGPTSKEGYGLTKKKKRSGELVGALTTDPVTISKRKKKFAKGKSSLRVRPTQNTLGGLKIRKSTGVGLS